MRPSYNWKNYDTLAPKKLLQLGDLIRFPWLPVIHEVRPYNIDERYLYNPQAANSDALQKGFDANTLQRILTAHEIPGNATAFLNEAIWPVLSNEQQSCFVKALFQSHAETTRARFTQRVRLFYKNHPPKEVPCPF